VDPAAVTGVLSGLIWAGAPYTGASMNPARTVGPDVVSGVYPALWVYLLGPIVGAALAEIAFRLTTRERTTLTAKLFHDSDYPSTNAPCCRPSRTLAPPSKPELANDRTGTWRRPKRAGHTVSAHTPRRVTSKRTAESR
jgi:hypothetical protein